VFISTLEKKSLTASRSRLARRRIWASARRWRSKQTTRPWTRRGLSLAGSRTRSRSRSRSRSSKNSTTLWPWPSSPIRSRA